MCEVKLYFSKEGSSLLSRARLYKLESRFGAIECRAVSESIGVSEGSLRTFRWSRAVRAMSALMVRTSLADLDPAVEPRISGGRGSMAASLDGALSKEPKWVLDAFGSFPNGSPVSRRLFARSNPGRKRLGPVAVSMASRIGGDEIAIYLNGIQLASSNELRRLLSDLESLGAHTG